MPQPPRKATSREIAEKVGEAALNLVPLVGGSMAVAFTAALGVGYNRRWMAWAENVAECITEMQDVVEGWPPFEELVKNDAFLDAVANAGRAVQATHQAEKLEALRNGVLHSIGPDAPQVDEQARFFRLVEQFSPAHLRLLDFLDNPGRFYDRLAIERPQLLHGGRASLLAQIPEFMQPREWIDLIAKDLTDAGLTNYGGLHVMQTGPSLWESAASPLGHRFLQFIQPPTALKRERTDSGTGGNRPA
jgi:hypothetical protein